MFRVWCFESAIAKILYFVQRKVGFGVYGKHSVVIILLKAVIVWVVALVEDCHNKIYGSVCYTVFSVKR